MVKVVEAKVMEVVAKGVTKGAVVVNKAVVIEDVGFVSALKRGRASEQSSRDRGRGLCKCT